MGMNQVSTEYLLSDHSAVCPCYECSEEMINEILDDWEND